MLRFVLPILFASGIPWAVFTWWRMRRARSASERVFIERTHTGVAIFVGLGVIALTALGPRERVFALPILLVVGLGIRHGIRKGRARLRAEQADAFSRAKRVN